MSRFRGNELGASADLLTACSFSHVLERRLTWRSKLCSFVNDSSARFVALFSQQGHRRACPLDRMLRFQQPVIVAFAAITPHKVA